VDVASNTYLFVGLERIAQSSYLFMILALAAVMAYSVIL
jgi:hypothetical protein